MTHASGSHIINQEFVLVHVVNICRCELHVMSYYMTIIDNFTISLFLFDKYILQNFDIFFEL